MSRAHRHCWVGHRYVHQCQELSGRICVERGCDRSAGTWWTPYWCPEHDVERQDQITAFFERLGRS